MPIPSHLPLPPRARRGLLPVAVAAALALGGIAAATPAAAKDPKDPYLPGEVLVRLHSTNALSGVLARHSLTLVSQSGARPLYRLHVADGSSVSAKVAELVADTDVIAAEANVKSQAPEARRNVIWAIGTEVDYREQWAPAAIHLAEAQALSRGAGVRVAVLDTGVELTHPALAGHLLPGHDFVDNDDDPSEVGTTDNPGFGHGTHVAGLVALAAPDAKIVPYRVLDPDGRGDIWMLQRALAYALDPDGNPATNDGAQVVNLSLGTLDRTRILRSLITLATCSIPKPGANPDTDYTDPGYDADKARCAAGNGAVVVAAAGNDGSQRVKEYPAAEGVYGLMPAGASADNHRFADFSNSGSWVDLAAPGDHITSSVPGGQYGTWSGTSMASPLMAGVAALLRAKAPAMKPVDVAKRLEKTGARLCGKTNTVQVDALATLLNKVSPPLTCP